MTAPLFSRMLCSLFLPLSLGAALLVGCGSDGKSSFSGAHPGTEGGSCDEGSCDDGLVCLSDTCVDPESGSNGSNSGSGGASSSSNGSGTDASGGSSSNAATGSGGGSSGGASSDGASGGSGGAPTDGSGGTGGAATDASGGSGGGSTGGAAGEGGELQCEGAHPNVNDQARTCDEGSCYCAGDPVDTCFPADTAEQCCDGMVRCGSDSSDRGVDCAGEHPVVTDETRTCEPGSCYCSDGETFEKCLTADAARICCPSDIELDCVPAE